MMTELETLNAKLAARENVPSYAENVAAIKKRIAELENAAG